MPHKATNLLLFLFINLLFSLINAQASPSPSSVSEDYNPNKTSSGVIVGSVFAAVIGIALIMVSILLWVRRQTQKAREAGGTQSRKKGRYATQNTSIGLDTSFAVPTGISSFNAEKKSASTVPHTYLYNTYAKAPLDTTSYGPSRQGSISISNGPTVPYQIPVTGPSSTIRPSPSQTSLASGFGPRPTERPIIRSLHRTNSDIFKALPEPPAALNPSPEGATETPPPPPVHSFAFPGSSDSKRESGEAIERSHLPHIVTASGSGGVSEQSKPFGTFGRPHHPYAPYAGDYALGGQRRGSNASTSSLGITLGASSSHTRGGSNQWGGAGLGETYQPSHSGADSRPRSQSLSSIQYGASFTRPSEFQNQGGPIYKSMSQNPSLTSLSYYPDATSADGLPRSYSQTILARPDSRASSVTSKKFENQLFSR